MIRLDQIDQYQKKNMGAECLIAYVTENKSKYVFRQNENEYQEHDHLY